MRTHIAALLLASVLAFEGCTIVPGVEPTDLSSVQEETATRTEVEKALGEPELSRATDEGRIDVYLYDRGVESKIGHTGHPGFLPLTPLLWVATPFWYAERVDAQEGYLVVVYDQQDRAVDYKTIFSSETPEEAIEIYNQRLSAEREWRERERERGREREELALGGDPEAQYQMGLRTRSDQAASRKWFRLAAEQGHVEALYALGMGSDTDRATRLNWLRLAAEQGHVEAMYALGKYSDAGSIEQWRWYCLAATQGHVRAQSELPTGYHYVHVRDSATMRRLGIDYRDTERDIVQAYKWFSLAAINGDRSAEWSRDRLAAQMSKEEIAEAERLVAEWPPKPTECEAESMQLEN